MGLELVFFPVGEESKGGDAIAFRYGNLFGERSEQMVVVIDGGYRDVGVTMVEYIRERFATNQVDIVISTHPDQDHVSGLEVVLEELSVSQLAMHLPWNHSDAVFEVRKSSFDTAQFDEAVEKSFRGASQLETLAARRGVPIVEPFAGQSTRDGALTIIGPTQQYYEALLAQLPAAGVVSAGLDALVAALLKGYDAVRAKLRPESLETETLRDSGTTSPTNNSSVITRLQVDGADFLFTGDAGIPALDLALVHLEAAGFWPGTFALVQVPHHWSRHNVGPSVLNRLLGPKGRSPLGGKFAVVSAAKKNPDQKHPAKQVTNAYIRRGYEVHATQGTPLRYAVDAPWASYQSSVPLPFHDLVEDEEDGA